MSARAMSRRRALKGLLVLGAGGAALSACGATPTPQVVEKVVTSVVEREVTKIVEGTPQIVKETVVITEVQTQVVEQVVTATPAPKGPVNLVLADYVYDMEDQQKLVDMWNADHPDMPMEGQFAPWDTYWTKIQTQIAGGQVPDVIDMSAFYVVVLAFRNGLLNIDPLIERDSFPIGDFYPTSVETFRWQYGQIRVGEGPLWAMPESAQCGDMFYYNKSIFDKEGIPYPDDSWDWDKLLAVAKALTKTASDGTTEQWGLIVPADARMIWWPYTWQAGGEQFDDEMKNSLAESEPSVTALQRVVDYFQVDKVCPLPGSMQMHPFMSGKVAMCYDGYWMATMTFTEITEFGWDVAAPPKGPVKRQIGLGCDAWSIMSGSKNIDAAWEFLKWASIDKGGDFIVQYINAGFPYKPLARKYTYAKDRTLPPQSLWIYDDLINEAHIEYCAGNYAEYASAATSEVEAAVIGKKTPQEAARDAATNVNSILAEAWKKYVG